VLNARSQAREIIASGQESGLAESQRAWELGYQAGSEQAQSEQSQLLQTLSQIVRAAAQDREKNMHSLDETVLTLVMEVAHAVLRREVRTSREAILHVVRGALSELSTDTSVAIRINPLDLQTLEQQRLDLGLPASIDVSFVADPAISPGGCLIESGAGRVDATIEKQLERIRTYFDDHLNAC
jgi:flagellar assembly protein FliH